MCCVVYQMEIFVLHMCVVCLFCFVQIKAEIGFETQNYDRGVREMTESDRTVVCGL